MLLKKYRITIIYVIGVIGLLIMGNKILVGIFILSTIMSFLKDKNKGKIHELIKECQDDKKFEEYIEINR